jgi:hypothetical protein
MSELSSLLLYNSINFQEVVSQRRENYLELLDVLYKCALFPRLPETVAPSGFPLCLRDRDAAQKMLFEHEIYPPVHWPLGNAVPQEFEESHRLSRQILTLPCDQRYGRSDMQQIAALVCRTGEM